MDLEETPQPLEYRERFIAAVQEGLADAEAGRIFEDEEVWRLLDEEFPLSDESGG